MQIHTYAILFHNEMKSSCNLKTEGLATLGNKNLLTSVRVKLLIN